MKPNIRAARIRTAPIRTARPDDASRLSEIYNHYVRETVITFEQTPIDAAEMARRIKAVGAQYPWLVYEEEGQVLGYAYATAWKARSAYRQSVESTVYLDPAAFGRGLGKELYAALIVELRAHGFHTVLGGIALPNDASVALHQRLGFEKVGHLAEVGRKFDRWVDVGYWQLKL